MFRGVRTTSSHPHDLLQRYITLQIQGEDSMTAFRDGRIHGLSILFGEIDVMIECLWAAERVMR
jgi:hypothetical protein